MRPVGLYLCLETSMCQTKRCPKCGHAMRVVDSNSVTNDGIKTVSIACANCHYSEPYSYRLEKLELPELRWRSDQQGDDIKD